MNIERMKCYSFKLKLRHEKINKPTHTFTHYQATNESMIMVLRPAKWWNMRVFGYWKWTNLPVSSKGVPVACLFKDRYYEFFLPRKCNREFLILDMAWPKLTFNYQYKCPWKKFYSPLQSLPKPSSGIRSFCYLITNVLLFWQKILNIYLKSTGKLFT